MTASRRFLYVSTSFLHVSCGMLAHSSLAKASSWVRLVGFLAITLVFKSRHKFSIGFRSGLWLGHSRTLTSLSLNHFFTALAVCFGSLSCWYFQLWPSWGFSADSFTFLSMILMQSSFLMIPWTLTRFPVPLEEKHPHSIMFPPPCLTVGTVFSFHPSDVFSIHMAK